MNKLKNALKQLGYSYLGSVIIMCLYLLTHGLFDFAGLIVAMVLPFTFGLPYLVGALIGLYVKEVIDEQNEKQKSLRIGSSSGKSQTVSESE